MGSVVFEVDHLPPPPILCRKNLKTRQVSSVHSNIKIQQPPGGHFGFVFEENSASKITWLPWCRTFSKISVFQIFSVHTKKQRQRFQFLLFQERFQKAPFTWRIRVEGRPNRRSKISPVRCWRGFSYKLNNATVSFPDKRMFCNFESCQP